MLRVYALSIYILLEAFVINEDKYHVFKTLQVVTPSFKSLINSSELLYLYFISRLWGDHLLTKKSY